MNGVKTRGGFAMNDKKRFLLQHKLMHFVNALHQYVMDKVCGFCSTYVPNMNTWSQMSFQSEFTFWKAGTVQHMGGAL